MIPRNSKLSLVADGNGTKEVEAEVLAKLVLSAATESGNAAGTAESDWF